MKKWTAISIFAIATFIFVKACMELKAESKEEL